MFQRKWRLGTCEEMVQGVVEVAGGGGGVIPFFFLSRPFNWSFHAWHCSLHFSIDGM